MKSTIIELYKKTVTNKRGGGLCLKVALVRFSFLLALKRPCGDELCHLFSHHIIFIPHLQQYVGIKGTALERFRSYLGAFQL